MGVILQLNNFTIFPYKHDVQFYGKLSTSYLSFIWVPYLILSIFFVRIFFLLSTCSVILPEHLCQGLTTRDRKGGLCLAHLLAA